MLAEDLPYVQPWVLRDEKAHPAPSQGSCAAGVAADHREADTVVFLLPEVL